MLFSVSAPHLLTSPSPLRIYIFSPPMGPAPVLFILSFFLLNLFLQTHLTWPRDMLHEFRACLVSLSVMVLALVLGGFAPKVKLQKNGIFSRQPMGWPRQVQGSCSQGWQQACRAWLGCSWPATRSPIQRHWACYEGAWRRASASWCGRITLLARSTCGTAF